MPIYPRKGKVNKYANYATSIIRGAMQAKRLYNSYSKMRNTKKSITNYVTTQKDASLQYRKKRMPYRKRRAWKKFYKKVQHVNLSQLGTNTVVWNRIYTVTNAAGAQGVGWTALYGKNGEQAPSNGAGMADLFKVQDGNTDLPPGSKVHFKSAVLDMTMTNKGTVPVELDVYDMVFWDEADFQSPQLLFENAQNATGTLPNGAPIVALTLDQRGVTPFDLPLAISLGKIKILRKMKYFLPAEDSVTYQVRDPRNRTLATRHIRPTNVNTSFVQPGWTRVILTIHKPTAGNQASLVPLHIGATRKYSFAIESSSLAQDGQAVF